ncbi:hypothetical protein ACHMW6_19805 [Pseudoduganella sp. UC29_106]|uniref:hypothetical protein n=1 Tax=Pseudoduganella sp. UC29_106 TaxID=3374553 RepID=UPI003757468E
MTEEISFKGPFKFVGEPCIFDAGHKVNGVYLWCVKSSDKVFRVYYVGEAENINVRMNVHLQYQLNGKYIAHCPERLRENIKVLMHRAAEGMLHKFSHIDAGEFNRKFIQESWIFFAELPVTGNSSDDKWLRCRFETGLARIIEDGGQNILTVGHLRYWKGEKSKVLINTGESTIEYLSSVTMDI